MPKQPSLIRLKDAAIQLGVSSQTLRRWDDSGKLKAVVINKRGDRRYHIKDIRRLIETESTGSDHPKRKGTKMEMVLEDLMSGCLKKWGFKIVRLRTQSGGSQFGKDNISIWTGTIDGKKMDFEWALEAKSHGNPSKRGVIPSDELKNKLVDIDHARAPRPDCWCVFAPNAIPENNFYDIAEGANANKKYPFKIIFWTQAEQIKDLISCFPEIHERVYGYLPTISSGKRPEILNDWKEKIIDLTKDAKLLKSTLLTSQSPSAHLATTPQNLDLSGSEKKIEQAMVQASLYPSTPPALRPSLNAAIESHRVELKEEIDKAVDHLNKGHLDQSRAILFLLLGRLEGKNEFAYELARIYNNLGVIFKAENDLDKAIEYFRKAINTQADFTIAISNLAGTYISKGEILTGEEAKKELEKAEKIILPLWEENKADVNNSVIRTYMRYIKVKDGLLKLLEFIEGYEKDGVENIFEKDGTLAFVAGSYYMEAQQPDKALKYAEKAYELEKDIETIVLRGRALMAAAFKADSDSKEGYYEDIAPPFKDKKTLEKAAKDFDDAMELAIKNKDTAYYSSIYYLQQLAGVWLGEPLDKISNKVKSQGLEGKMDTNTDTFIKAVKVFRERNFETSYVLLKSLPEFENLTYAEILRLGRVYLYNGSPEIARRFFDLIEEESLKRKDFHYWLDCSVIAALLGEKNKAIITASTAKTLAEGQNRRIVLSHFGAVVLRYAGEEGGDRLLENAFEFEKEFPELPILERFNYEQDKAKIVNMVKERYDWVNNIKNIFRANPIPSYFLQKTFKKPYILIWRGRDPEMPIEYTAPAEDFQNELTTNLSQGKFAVFDYISLLTLSKLDMLSDIQKFFHKIQIPFTLFLKIQDELIQEEDPNLRRLWDFLRGTNQIEIVKEIPHKKLQGKRMNDIFEPWVEEAIKLAKGSGKTLVTDDLRFYRFVKSEKITPINTWVILQNAKKTGLLDQKMYSKNLGKLAECFYTFLGFSGDDLYEITAEDHFKLTPRSYHLLNQIFLPASNYKSFSAVFVKFIWDLWKSGSLSEDKVFWLGYLSNILATLVDKYQDQPVQYKEAVLDTADDFGMMWKVAIDSGNKDDLLFLKEKVPELLKHNIFSKAKVNIMKQLEAKLGELSKVV